MSLAQPVAAAAAAAAVRPVEASFTMHKVLQRFRDMQLQEESDETVQKRVQTAMSKMNMPVLSDRLPPSMSEPYRWRRLDALWSLAKQTHKHKLDSFTIPVFTAIDSDEVPRDVAITPDIYFAITTKKSSRQYAAHAQHNSSHLTAQPQQLILALFHLYVHCSGGSDSLGGQL